MDADEKLHSHERECALRYEMIEKRLDEGSQKMRRLEMMIIGVYPFIVASVFLAHFLN